MDMAERKKQILEEIESALKKGNYVDAIQLCENSLEMLDDSEIERIMKPVVEEVRRALEQKATGRAETLLVSLVHIADRMYKPAANGFVFTNVAEFMLYVSRHNQENVVWIRSPRLEVYYLYGYLLVETKRLEQAQAVFEKALQFAPASIMVYFEYAETYKLQRNFKKFAELTLRAMQYTTRKEHVARCLRNIGYVEIENGNFKLASAYYYISMDYDHMKQTAMTELNYIFTVTKQVFPMPENEERERVLSDVCRQAGITKEQLPQKI